MRQVSLFLCSAFIILSLSACSTELDTPTQSILNGEQALQTDGQLQQGPPPGGTPGGHPPPGGPGGGPGGPPDLSAAAETLGVSEADLQEAMRVEPGQEPDFAAIAQELGVTEEALRAAVPPPPQRPR